jgi:chromatin remodeling complex protein RSC6
MATKKKAAKKAAKKPAKKAAPKKAVKKAAPKKAKKAAPKKAAPKKKTARKPNAAFMKALTPSSTLAGVIGPNPVPRTEAVKRIWDHIKKNNLQDSANRRMINADEKLRPLFGKDQISMFDLAKILSKHLS